MPQSRRWLPVLALVLAVLVPQNAHAATAFARTVQEQSDLLYRSDQALGAACTRPHVTDARRCLTATGAEEKQVQAFSAAVAKGDPGGTSTARGLEAGLRSALLDLADSLSDLESAVRAGSRVHYDPDSVHAAAAQALGYAGSLADAATARSSDDGHGHWAITSIAVVLVLALLTALGLARRRQ